jgi:hypothetical protein
VEKQSLKDIAQYTKEKGPYSFGSPYLYKDVIMSQVSHVSYSGKDICSAWDKTIY